MDKQLNELSKEISYALRHAPWEYELEMDEMGWVPIEQLLDALHKQDKWKEITQKDIQEMLSKAEKKDMRLRMVKYEHFMDIQYL